MRIFERKGRGLLNPSLLRHALILLAAVVPGAMATSVRSVYLITVAKIDPFIVGSFNYVSTLLGIVLVYYASRRYLDQVDPVRISVAAAILATFASLCILASLYTPYFLVGAAVCSALAQVGGSSVFLYDERYGPSAEGNAGLYRTRLLLSVAWIIGPPLSFALFWVGGFQVVVIATAAFGAFSSAAMIAVSRSRPPTIAAIPPSKGTEPRQRILGFWPIFIIMVATTGANVLHSINMPLYLIQVRQVPAFWPGLIMGAAALVEVLVIGLLPNLSKASSDETVLWTGLAAGAVYFLVLGFLTDPLAILFCQVLYGAHFAATTVVCLPLLRRALAGGTGSLAAQFNNASRIGSLLSAAIFAMLATAVGFRSMLVVICPGLLVIGLVFGIARWFVQRRSSRAT